MACSEEVANTRLHLVEEEASGDPLSQWTWQGRDAKGGGEGLADNDGRLIQTVGIEQKESQLVETVLDKNRSAR